MRVLKALGGERGSQGYSTVIFQAFSLERLSDSLNKRPLAQTLLEIKTNSERHLQVRLALGLALKVPIWPTAEVEEDPGHALKEAFLQRPCGLQKSFLRKA